MKYTSFGQNTTLNKLMPKSRSILHFSKWTKMADGINRSFRVPTYHLVKKSDKIFLPLGSACFKEWFSKFTVGEVDIGWVYVKPFNDDTSGFYLSYKLIG